MGDTSHPTYPSDPFEFNGAKTSTHREQTELDANESNLQDPISSWARGHGTNQCGVTPAIDRYHFVFELALGLGYARAVIAFLLIISSSGLSTNSYGSLIQTSFRVWTARAGSGKRQDGTTKGLFTD